MDGRTWTNDDDGVFDPVEEQTQEQAGTEDNTRRTRCSNNDDVNFGLCDHDKNRRCVMTGRSTNVWSVVRAKKLKLQKPTRGARITHPLHYHPPCRRVRTPHPSTTPQLSYPGSFPPRKSVGAYSDSLGERRCGSYGTTRSSRGLSQAVTRPRLSSQGIPRPNPGPSRSPCPSSHREWCP